MRSSFDGAKMRPGNIQELLISNIIVARILYPVCGFECYGGRDRALMMRKQAPGAISSIYHAQKRMVLAADPPKEPPDLIYLCFPNNPTGSSISKDRLQKMG